ncbi:hypothetical protein Tco_1127816 [Tanacetum coccineum]
MRNEQRNRRGGYKWQTKYRFEYRKRHENGEKSKRSVNNKGNDGENDSMESCQKHDNKGTRKTKENGKEHQQGSKSKERSERNRISGTNRFNVLRSLYNKDELNINFDFRGRKEMFNAAKENEENEDVVEIECVEGNDILSNEVEGGGGSILN